MVSPGGKMREKKGTKTRKPKGEPELPQEYVPPPLPLPGDDFAMPVREVVKPDNQLQLSEAELNDEVAKMLTANNPTAPRNVARYNVKERAYKFEPMVEQTITHYAADGWLLHRGADEARRQIDMDKMEQEAASKHQSDADRSLDRRDDGDEAPDDSRQLRNQFNFSDRAAQTINYPLKDRETFTEPPPTRTIQGSCTQWGIYDEYIKDLERQRVEEQLKSKGGRAKTQERQGQKHQEEGGQRKPDNPMQNPLLGQAAHILDRMANQNMFEEIAMDFKYWEDASDAVRPKEGSLLPLWKFGSDKARRRQVTSLCWNPLYNDMFAVGYGSYDFLKQASGLVNIYSLKNPSHPEFAYSTESGVMCLHFHPGTLLLDQACCRGDLCTHCLRKSTPPLGMFGPHCKMDQAHCLWALWGTHCLWKSTLPLGIFGPHCLWTRRSAAGALWGTPPLRIFEPDYLWTRLTAHAASKERNVWSGYTAGPSITQLGCRPVQGPNAGCRNSGTIKQAFWVGTEEGSIHKCSKAYSSQYLSSYQAHSLAVYSVKWNCIHHKTFLSASADWLVKLWDANQPRKPILTFDFKDAVGDIAWAPYSATVFAAVTDDGKVHVYDLYEDKLMPMCAQKVVKKAKLTKIVFNPKWPIILVGDDKGVVTSLKLSPNLRKQPKIQPGQKETLEQLEWAKLDHVIDVACRSDPEAMKEQAAAAAKAS
ncbi:flagellar outer dynein arm intermediate chain 1 [Dunaliella salina]|uniref:Flagellar outer dynein arm intermediate chain 1 n=1 Tax=Dunaliella salina TaxID=3046 RepID=A0ABQ7GMF6_DUNSA|nr:flagellar outer dynein arm intermediate chain 1 [Dunaliella salina]|eukprot:KAF5835756.1 flagellar outer dynein arm intermediate chain 1 [Dunaliella salina]